MSWSLSRKHEKHIHHRATDPPPQKSELWRAGIIENQVTKATGEAPAQKIRQLIFPPGSPPHCSQCLDIKSLLRGRFSDEFTETLEMERE
jgi:hypothetical protein